MKVLGYARASTDKQGETVDDQHREISSWTKDHSRLDLIDSFEDVGVSGGVTPLERTGFEELAQEMDRDDEVGGLVVTDIDRVSRDTDDRRKVLAELKWRCGRDEEPDLWIVGKGQWERSEGLEGIIDDVQDRIDEEERLKAKRKTKRRMQNRKSRGLPVGNPPRGLTTDKQREDLENAHHWVADESDTIQRIIRLLNTVAHETVDPLQNGQDPSPHTLGKQFEVGGSSPTYPVRTIWKNRHIYRDVVERELSHMSVLWDELEVIGVSAQVDSDQIQRDREQSELWAEIYNSEISVWESGKPAISQARDHWKTGEYDAILVQRPDVARVLDAWTLVCEIPTTTLGQ